MGALGTGLVGAAVDDIAPVKENVSNGGGTRKGQSIDRGCLDRGSRAHNLLKSKESVSARDDTTNLVYCYLRNLSTNKLVKR